jgi:hypothetical protein
MWYCIVVLVLTTQVAYAADASPQAPPAQPTTPEAQAGQTQQPAAQVPDSGRPAPQLQVLKAMLTAGGGLIDIRYRLKGAPPRIFGRDRDLHIIEESSGEKFYVLGVPKIGQLAPKRVKDTTPVSYLIFQNRGGKLKKGEHVVMEE